MDGDLRAREAVTIREHSGVTPQSGPRDAGSAVRASTGDPAWRTPVHEVSRARLEPERVLPPGAAGPNGAPYKLLRTQVLQRMAQLGCSSLAVMSPTDGAGKTLTAINLAIAIAAERARHVLLVDFDLRRPGIARRLGLKASVGVEEVLTSGRPVHEALFRLKDYERLTVLAAREPVENSAELLADPVTAQLVEEMRGRYTNRVLIFDLPPILQSDDALLFSRLVGAGLLVVGESHTRREDVLRSLQMLPELPFVGTVLNGARESEHARY